MAQSDTRDDSLSPPVRRARSSPDFASLVRPALFPFDREIDLTDLIFHDTILCVRCAIRNSGTLPWKNLALADAGQFRGSIRLFPPARSAPPRSALTGFGSGGVYERPLGGSPLEQTVAFDRAEVNPGESTTVTAWFDLGGMVNGVYRLELDILRGAIPFAALGVPPFVREITRSASVPLPEIPVSDQVPTELAHVTIHHLELLPFGVISLRGETRNTGTAPWSERTDRSAPILIGTRLLAFEPGGATPCVEEQRQHLHRDPLLPGEQLSFTFSYSLLGQPPGTYVVEAGVVKEWNYWIACDSSSITTRTIEWRGPVAPPSKEREIPLHRLRPRGAPCRILVISPSLPLFDRQYGGRRLFDILLSLRRNGHAVTFIYEQRGRYGEEAARYVRALEAHDIVVGSQPVSRITESRSKNHYDLVILTWHETAHRYLSLLRTLIPQTRIIVDSVDVHWVREQRAVEAGLSATTPAELDSRRAIELESYRAADIVWTVSDPDRIAVAAELPGKVIQVVPSFFSTVERSQPRSTALTLVLLGSFRHPPNESAALWSIEIVRRARQLLGEDIRLRIIGEQPPPTILELEDGEVIKVCGHVPDLADVFRGADLLIAPIVYGSGIRGKIIDALAYGVPSLTTPLGIEGLPLAPWTHYLSGTTTGELIQVLRKVAAGSFDLAGIAAAAADKLRMVMGPTAVGSVIEAAVQCPPVAICIVTCNRRDMLERCFESLLLKTKHPDYRIAVWSNGCSDGTVELLESLSAKYPGLIDIYRSEENRFFVEPSNELIARYPDRDIVLMNNDIEVEREGWLYYLYMAAYSAPDVAGSGGMLLDDAGRVLEAGASMNNLGKGIHFGRGLMPNDPRVMRVRPVGYVSGALMYMRRDAIARYGSLSSRFQPMYFEDCEWHYRMHRHGLQTVYTPHARAVHHEGTSGGHSRYFEQAREQFIEEFEGVDLAALTPESEPR